MTAASNDARPVETVDAVVVGTRMAGCAAAIALHRAGRTVVALDRAKFPSNVLSTHGIWPSGISELERLGALDHVMRLDPPKLTSTVFQHLGLPLWGPFRPVDGIDYALCIPRTELDLAVVTAARDQGVDVRERSTVTEVVWDAGRATGVRYRGPGGRERQIRARLVIGADGRRSTVAEQVGAAQPYRGSRNGRGFVYWYMDDPKLGTPWRETGTLWRIGDTMVLVGPMPAGRLLVLGVCPAASVSAYRRDPEGMWERLLREHRRLADRVAGATRPTRMFSTAELTAFYRRSSGPGWALVGDAGHFKDPSIAQGIRDALHFGRLLGEAAAPVLGIPARLDRALTQWERDRDRRSRSTYHWANRETRVDPVQPLLLESLRTFLANGGVHEFGDVLSRVRDYEDVVTPLRGVVWLSRALARPGADRRLILRQVRDEMTIDRDVRIERLLDRFRPTRHTASELPGWSWPPRRDEDSTNGAGGGDMAQRGVAVR